MYSLNEEKIKIAIPTLHGKYDFRHWDEGITLVLETKSLLSYINYKFEKPMKFLQNPMNNMMIHYC